MAGMEGVAEINHVLDKLTVTCMNLSILDAEEVDREDWAEVYYAFQSLGLCTLTEQSAAMVQVLSRIALEEEVGVVFGSTPI